MSKVFAFFVGIFLVQGACAQETVINDPNAQLRQVKGYHGIRVSNAIELYLSHGQEERVAVSANDIKTRDRIVTEVVEGILVIRLEGKLWQRLGNHKIKAYVSFTTLDQISASGASDVYVDGVIAGDRLNFDFSGASVFKGAVKVNELTLTQSGASDSQLTGQVSGHATFRMSGASDVKGYNLVVDECSVHSSGASDVTITVNKQLDVDLSGASSVYYKGVGVVRDSHTSGASTVSHKS
jgi:hypothetical protein